jgi:hypothetical protein
MQQACESVAEQTGEVVRNDEVGREERFSASLRSDGNITESAHATDDVDGGETGRKPPTNPKRGDRQPPIGADGAGRQRCPSVRTRSEAHEGRASASAARRERRRVNLRETSKVQPGDR